MALVEATLTTEAEGTVQHLSARQAGATAAEAGAERLLVTHLTPGRDRAGAPGSRGRLRPARRGGRSGQDMGDMTWET